MKLRVKGDHNEVSRLISEGAIFESDGVYGMNPLHIASMNGHLEVCKVLLRANVLVDVRNMFGKTALHLSAMNGHYDIVNLLIESHAAINICDMLEMTPLHWACDRGHSDIVFLLLRNGADPSHFNKFNKSPNYLAMERGYLRIVELIKSHNFSKSYLKSKSHHHKDEDKSSPEGASSQSSSSSSGHSYRAFAGNRECASPSKIEEILRISDDDEFEEAKLAKEQFNCHLKLDEEMDEDSDNQDDLLRSLDELENASFSIEDLELFDVNSAELLRAQAVLGSLDDPALILRRAVCLGRTIKLTEAGKRAMAMIVPVGNFVVFTFHMNILKNLIYVPTC
ncbi:Transport and Golgi organization protein 2-like protein [Armadillidium vulgare]|nr:Transport and Golgi organization protein 2-like protein [Armadillidium vulgare]